MGKPNWNEILGWTFEQIDDLRLLGFSYLRQGKYDVATPIFEALVLLSHDNPYDLQTLGALYLETGHNLQALNTIEQALKLDPAHDTTLLNRTKALFALGYKRQALAQAKALELLSNQEVAGQAIALLLAHS